MKLRQYLTFLGYGALVRFSATLGAHAPDVSKWAEGRRPIPMHWAMPIERASSGMVMRWDSRPDDWHEHWPELRMRKDAPPVVPLKEAA